MTECLACFEQFEPETSRQKRCRECITLDRRAGSVNVVEKVAPGEVREALALLSDAGYRVSLDQGETQTVKLANKKTKRYRLALCGDMHLGSDYQQLTYLHDFYRQAEEFGAEAMLNMGDLVHGSPRMHADMLYESFVHGASAQVDYAVQNYPRSDKFPTYIISGNHDLSFLKDGGSHVVADFAKQRDDVTYLGQEDAYFKVGGASLYIWHPGGGGGKSRCLKLQNFADSVSPESKPHVAACGHYHTAGHVPAYRNIELFQVPCFQAQTPFEKRHGLSPVVGGILLELQVSPSGLEQVDTRWVIYRQPLKEDY